MKFKEDDHVVAQCNFQHAAQMDIQNGVVFVNVQHIPDLPIHFAALQYNVGNVI